MMAMAAAVCSADFMGFLTSTIFPLAAYAGIIAATVIAISFMIGQALRNPKITVWAKTEIVQLFMSFISLLLLGTLLGFFCSISMNDIASIFEISYSGPDSMFEAAHDYLFRASTYAHTALTVIRYHLEGYTILAFMGEFECDLATGPIGWGCWFGYSGASVQPFGGYAALTAALNTAFNSILMAYLMSLNYLMILLYAYKGFAFFLFPIGIFMRSMPYMRSFGSVLMALAISFTIVYPFFLAVFDLMADGLIVYDSELVDNFGRMSSEDVYPDNSAGVGASLASAFSKDYVKDNIYFEHGDEPAKAIAFGGAAFIVAFLFPSVALLGAIASTVYIARLYGEEIDLSRIMQMV